MASSTEEQTVPQSQNETQARTTPSERTPKSALVQVSHILRDHFESK